MPTNGVEAVMAAAVEIDRVTPLTVDDLDALSSRFTAWRLQRANMDVDAALKTTVDDLLAHEMDRMSLKKSEPWYKIRPEEIGLEGRESASFKRKEHAKNTRRKQADDHRAALRRVSMALASKRRTEKARRTRLDNCTDNLVRMRAVKEDAPPPRFVYVCGGRSRAAPIPFAGTYTYVQSRRASTSSSTSLNRTEIVYKRMNQRMDDTPVELRQYTTTMSAPPGFSPPPVGAWCFIDPRNKHVLGWTRYPHARVTKLIGRRIEYELVGTGTPATPTTTTTRRILMVPIVNDDIPPNFLCHTAKSLVDKNVDHHLRRKTRTQRN